MHLGGADKFPQGQGLLHPALIVRHPEGVITHGQADVEALVGSLAHPALPGENPMDEAGQSPQAGEAV